MTKLSISLAALCVWLSLGAASGAGMGMHHSSSSGGGAFGSSAAAPGTNSLGTALSSSGRGNGRMKGPPLGTGSPAVDREDKQVARIVHSSICRGC
ncbi:hypothetical protein [Bradyrhizobium sp. Tv2a-2]|uniref:hypothetical protein n=1 Tax=Bradyrhizobium sp. Tv2a-2 TaxID=113395 RepID=UPI000466712E|nr:hypothetical protein [Bradyrhizobium sp. Tv2a-2]